LAFGESTSMKHIQIDDILVMVYILNKGKTTGIVYEVKQSRYSPIDMGSSERLTGT